MKKLKIVFLGTPDFAVPCLEKLLNSDHEVVAVVTAQDKPRGRGLKVQSSPVKRLAQLHLLPILQPDILTDTVFIEQLHKFSADLFIVVGFRILPEEVFTIPPMGTVNLHASLLPKYRGAAPINWAIMNGETETGLTTFYIEKTVDTGNIILQQNIPITPDQTAGELYTYMAPKGAELLFKTIECIAQETAPKNSQQGEPSRAPKLTREICEILWHKAAEDIHNLVRGLSPYPAAFTYCRGRVLKVFRTKVIQTPSTGTTEGIVTAVNRKPGGIHVATGSGGTISLCEVQLEGKCRMLTEEFLLGNPIEIGTKLGR